MEFDQEKADYICREIANRRTLKSIMLETGIPTRYWLTKWMAQQPEFEKQYNAAREMFAEALMDEILEICDDESRDTRIAEDKLGRERPTSNQAPINRDRLRVISRQWLIAKINPKKYGELLQVSGPEKGPIQHQYVDVPPDETREQWIERKEKELAERNAMH